MPPFSPATTAPPHLERWLLRLSPTCPLPHLEHGGSMLRGAFGHALKALACACGSETHRPDCLYQQIFEPATPAGWPLRYRDCPPAYVITPPARIRSATHLDFGFTLLGPALEHRALLWQAWQQAAAHGLGQQQIPARLQALGHEPGLPAVPGSGPLRLQLVSPLLLKRKQPGQTASRPLGPAELGCSDLLIALHRRLELTHRLYGVPATPLPALETWLSLHEHLTLRTHLQEHHFARHSNRQQQRMPLYGLSGDIHLSGPLPSSLRTALNIGQWLHVGGKTALGFGGYRLHSSHESSVHDRRSAS